MRELGGAARAGLACVAGLAQAASLAWPGSGEPLWWLQILSLAVFAGLLRSATRPVRAALLAGLFATAWLCGSFWWLFTSLHTYGGLPAPLAVLAVLGLALFLASYYAIAGGLYVLLAPASRLGAALLFAGLWLLAELARNTLWTGFPWGAGGYAHVDGPLAGLARLVGVYGIGFVAALLAMLVASLRAADLRRTAAWLLLGTLAGGLAAAIGLRHCALGGCNRPAIAAHAPLGLALLQGNIPQDEKFQVGSGVPTALAWYARELSAASAALVVAPETALPLLPAQLPPGYLEAIARRYAKGDQAAMVGIPLGDMKAGYTNSVLGPHHGRDGREVFHFPDGRELTLPVNAPVLFYLQRLRDEVHRYAIGAHRTKRAKAITASPLDEVPGIGPARKKALLLHFGTARAVRSASLEDLQKAPGVSATVAQTIYDFYHGGG